MVTSMLEHGRMVTGTGKEHSLGPMVTGMLEHSRMIKGMGKEHRLMLKVQTGPGNGRTTNKKNKKKQTKFIYFIK
jgi:hypothetical protein